MPKVVSIYEREKEFSSEGFYVFDKSKSILMCKFCNCRIDWVRKDTCSKHCEGAGHKKMKIEARTQGVKRQASLQETLLNNKKAKLDKTAFINATCKAFLEANIPMEKLDSPSLRAWMNEYVKGAGDLPAADTLRKLYIPKVREQEEAALKQNVKGKQVSILCDETTDRKGQCVFLVLIKILECSAASQLYVGGVKILLSANATECARAIVEVINKLEIPFEQITSVVTDSARYMTKCVDSLKVLFGDSLVHVQCWAHKINLVSSIFQVELKELNNCVIQVKNAFLNTRKRKHSYQTFLKEKYQNGEKEIKLFPSPVITRWNSWHKSVVYIHTYLADLHEFFSTMEEGGGAVQALRSLTNAEVAVIQCQATYVVEHCTAIVSLLEILEGSYPYSHKLQTKLQDVGNSLKIVSEGCFGDETSAQLKIVTRKHAAALTTTLANAAAKANVKLAQLQNEDTAKSFLRAIGQLFDERLLGSVTIEQIRQASRNVPLISSLPTQVVLEGHAALKTAITTAVYAGRKFDLLEELLSLKEDHENFVDASVKSLWVPVSNVDSERGFSAYTNILIDRRTTLSPANVELMLSLTFGD